MQFKKFGRCNSGKADSTLRSSQAVPHPSTDRALSRLTSEVERDPVHSTWYGRQRKHCSVTYHPGPSKKQSFVGKRVRSSLPGAAAHWTRYLSGKPCVAGSNLPAPAVLNEIFVFFAGAEKNEKLGRGNTLGLRY